MLAPKFRVVPYYQTIVAIDNVVPNKFSGSLAVVKRVRSDITWEMLLRDKFPYYVGSGKSSMAKCRGCGYKFTKEELRIQFEINRKLGQCVMPSCEVNVCMKWSCIQNAYRRRFRFKPLVRWTLLLTSFSASTFQWRSICYKPFTATSANCCHPWN